MMGSSTFAEARFTSKSVTSLRALYEDLQESCPMQLRDDWGRSNASIRNTPTLANIEG